jgi:hypothetical protein
VLELLNAAKELDPADVDGVRKFVELVRNESEETLATLDGLEEEIQELQSKGDEIKARETTLEMLEEKYQKHFDSYQRQAGQRDG